MPEPLNIVIPMAGRGSRFSDGGFALPKPLIDVRGRPMIDWVVRNLRPSRPHRFIFLCLSDHLARYDMRERLQEIAPGAKVVAVEGVTEGALCTVLLARHLIDSPAPLMIANSDQWIDTSIDEYLALSDRPDRDGLIMTMWADHPKWSYVRLNASDDVIEVVEKEVVSTEATVGIYNFARGSQFVRAAERMIARDVRVNGEFYVAPVYNAVIDAGGVVDYANVGRVEKEVYGLGTPDDLEMFIRVAASQQ